MPFEQVAEYDFDNLPTETKYRFAELELNFAITNLKSIYKHDPEVQDKAPRLLYEILFPFVERHYQVETEFMKAITSPYFRGPQKSELINYFLYHQQSYKTIRAITGASPNTIARFRYQQAPIYYPVFQEWTPERLHRWDSVKANFNLFLLPQIQNTI